MNSYRFKHEKIRRARLFKKISLEEISNQYIELIRKESSEKQNIKKELKADSIRKWETGDSTPSAKQIALLATILDVRIEYFFSDKTKLEDVNERLSDDAIKKMAEQIENLQAKIMPAAEYDPLAHHVKTHRELREVVEMLIKMDKEALIEARGLIKGFMVGSRKQETEEPYEEEKGNLNAG